jgi:hypothetical protein
MTISFCIKTDQLRKALLKIEAAEANGFKHCESIFHLTSAGPFLGDCQAVYSDMIEKAHPTDPSLNWGRFQGVTQNNRFIDGGLVKIT